MSGKLRRSNVKWESSTEEDDICESRCKMRLRDTLRSTQQSAEVNNEFMEQRKRGRGPSKRPCLNRNALMARENRLRKKAYLEKIENKLSFYHQENKNLMNIIRKQNMMIKRLSGDVSYLKSVLNNNTTITALLRTINDGLRKISVPSKNELSSNHVSENSNELQMQQSNTSYASPRENELNVQNSNVYIPHMNGNTSIRHNTSSDHTYTTANNSVVDMKNEYWSKEPSNAISSLTSSVSEDGYMENTKELDHLLPIAQTDLCNLVEKKDIDSIGIDFDQLPSFNMDVFEDLSKCDEMMNATNNLNEAPNHFTEEIISQTLDSTGICLHVNSNKVSLEFCSICHLNSKESKLN